MHDHASFACRAVARLLIWTLAALWLAVPVLAGPDRRPKEKSEAERVAKKVARALGTAHQAEEERKALRHFQEEVAKYSDFHAVELAKLGSPEDPVAAQAALAHVIAAKRAKARQGDIFRPDVQLLFRRLIAEQLKGPDTRDAQRAVLEGNPADGEEVPVLVVARINAVYPPGASRSTVPPSVLGTLPELPACLHYRFVVRDLVLIDSVADLIVDILPAAAPDPATKELP